jgi:hypothetical protein
MASVIPTPAWAIAQVVFIIGPTQIESGEITGIGYMDPKGTATVGTLIYEVCFNRETSTENREKFLGTAIYVDHPTALTAFGARG